MLLLTGCSSTNSVAVPKSTGSPLVRRNMWRARGSYKQIILTKIINWNDIIIIISIVTHLGAPPWSSGSVLDHRSLPPVFESWRRHIWRLFRLSLRFITFGCGSSHLAYLVHKSGRKTSIIIMLLILIHLFQIHLLATHKHVNNTSKIWRARKQQI